MSAPAYTQSVGFDPTRVYPGIALRYRAMVAAEALEGRPDRIDPASTHGLADMLGALREMSDGAAQQLTPAEYEGADGQLRAVERAAGLDQYTGGGFWDPGSRLVRAIIEDPDRPVSFFRNRYQFMFSTVLVAVDIAEHNGAPRQILGDRAYGTIDAMRSGRIPRTYEQIAELGMWMNMTGSDWIAPA